MRVLTLTQPYASLIALGQKRIETRSWRTSYRGPLAIHAAQGLGSIGGKQQYRDICQQHPFAQVIGAADLTWEDLPLGAIVATCELRDCLPIERVINGDWIQSGSQMIPLSYQERMFGNYAGPGRYAWLLANIRALPEPIPAKGAQGLWNWEPPSDFSFS